MHLSQQPFLDTVNEIYIEAIKQLTAKDYRKLTKNSSVHNTPDYSYDRSKKFDEEDEEKY